MEQHRKHALGSLERTFQQQCETCMLPGIPAPNGVGQPMERAYRNLGYVLLILLPIFVAGFWIPYFSEIPHFESSITWAVHIHAVLLFCFLVLLIFQPIAIRFRADRKSTRLN